MQQAANFSQHSEKIVKDDMVYFVCALLLHWQEATRVKEK